MFKDKRLLLILLLALGLRIWGVPFGLPRVQHIDEGALIHSAFFMAAEHGRPAVLVHGTVFPGIMALFSGSYFLLGQALGWFADTQEFLVSYIKDPTLMVLFGRLLNVFFAVLTVWFIYLVGKRLFNRRVGFLASAFLAVSTLHVMESHYVKPDVLTALVSLALLYVSYRISRKGQRMDYILAGVLFALGVSTKSSMALILPTILLAHLLYVRKQRKRKLALGVILDANSVRFLLVSGLVYLVLNPYLVLDTMFYIREFERFHGTLVFDMGDPHSPLWYYVFQHLPNGLGIGVWALAIFGAAIAIIRTRKYKDFLLVSFPVVFLVSVNIWSRVHVQRYVMPIVPYLVLLAAFAFDFLLKKAGRLEVARRAFFSTLVILVIIWQPLIRTLKFDWIITRPHTGVLSTDWIQEHIPSGSRIAVDGVLLWYVPSVSGPYLFPTQQSIGALLAGTREGDTSGAYLRAYVQAIGDIPGYEIIGVPSLSYGFDGNYLGVSKYDSVDPYLEKNVDAIITSSWVREHYRNVYPWSDAFSRSFQEHYILEKEFVPTVDFAHDPIAVRVDYRALDRVKLFDREQVFGPKISIYRRNEL